MANNEIARKLPNVPLAKPGFDALNLAAPTIIQSNAQGKWESKKPSDLDTKQLQVIVQHLVNSKAISAAQSYCCQCALDNKNTGMKSNYVPVIMMPISSADDCPFDMCDFQETGPKDKKQAKKTEQEKTDSNEDKDDIIKPKKRGFVMQRLTDFDLMSQW